MSSTIRRSLFLAARLLCVAALPVFALACTVPETCPEGEDCDTDGGLPPDFCNSRAEADEDALNCHLTVNQGPLVDGGVRKTDVFISRLLDGGADLDWYLATLPATMNARSLLHVVGGYQAPQTGVNFSLNLLTTDSAGKLTSIASGVDKHGAAAPKPVDLILPFSTPNAKLYVLAGDEGANAKINVDNRNPYTVMVQVQDNPDSNEPNDTAAAATAIAMASANGGLQGTTSGYLATQDDVDQYRIDVTGTGLRLIYLHITGPNPHPTNPPPPYRLSYTLYNPAGVSVSEGRMDNEFLAIDLATSRVVTTETNGAWRLEVKGYKQENSTAKVGGDLNLKYDVQVRVLPEEDSHEPNDAIAQAKLVTLASPGAGGATTFTLHGKQSTVPDEEWFRLVLPSRGSPSTLRYKLTVAAGGGRFNPLSAVPARQLRVLSTVTDGATPSDRQNNCLTKDTACHKGYSGSSSNQALLVSELCKSPDGVFCLQSLRNEQALSFTAPPLENFVGAVLVPAAGGEYFVVLHSEGAKYADDREWTIELTWADDSDPSGITPVALGGSTTSTSGTLSFGYGAFLNGWDGTHPHGIRGDNSDYDSWESDDDIYEFSFGGATAAQGWAIEWETEHGVGVEPPGEVIFELTFCTGASPGTQGRLCQGAQTELLGYNPDPATPWYLDSNQASNASHLFTATETSTSTIIKAEPIGCWCFSDPRVQSGHFFLNVRAANRISNEPIRYTLRQSIGNYPAFPSASCPGNAGVDAGTSSCGFAP